MQEVTKKSDSDTIRLAREELKKLPGAHLALRLKAVIASRAHPVHLIAQIFEVSPRTIFRWTENFKAEGLEGLMDKPKGHPASKLSDKHKTQIQKWVLRGRNSSNKKVRWTLAKLKDELEKVFGVSISATALWNHLEKMNLTVKR